MMAHQMARQWIAEEQREHAEPNFDGAKTGHHGDGDDVEYQIGADVIPFPKAH